jgi:hypothetical protein
MAKTKKKLSVSKRMTLPCNDLGRLNSFQFCKVDEDFLVHAASFDMPPSAGAQ